jgi:hypothetical protein
MFGPPWVAAPAAGPAEDPDTPPVRRLRVVIVFLLLIAIFAVLAVLVTPKLVVGAVVVTVSLGQELWKTSRWGHRHAQLAPDQALLPSLRASRRARSRNEDEPL